MQIIENREFRAEIDEHGAQLTHLYNKKADFDYIWNGQEWGKHAPVLFPAIGRSNKDQYVLNGKTYSMPQHGFVADEDFTVRTHEPNILTLVLKANDRTKELYPFDFELAITFTLLSTGLSLSFEVTNKSAETMPFSLGSHPAFNVPINGVGKFDNYRVRFTSTDDDLSVYEIVKTPAPYRTGKQEPLLNSSGNLLELNYETFKPGLRIITNSGIKSVKLYSPLTSHQIQLDIDQFKNVCLWTKEDEDCSFLCIEPFNGLPDVLGEPVDWMQKEGNLFLDANSSQVYQYEMHLS
ncbi:aldose 1-epimerase family protein [Limosilactobacillus sp. STM2_1]|uniref:Aldose 1-epimerase family protein n=1 Tax=Limosilactobacillus rudii TaxID=2759755 RepID=A0A7W3YM53_9LACO|nr:aldose 1-epimerase family protein [Limosilactobacillus rudii]MBB1078679.1 aldose 1-epimerase family protein [Limosilactobacillus rudii]MBB1096753.1 aldose 1-epimerase family protein [Limosilactobacillus rudii]MCD7135575.1 aldose 1-epimerase family protein [Limosilactobacillus rudii]